MRRLHGIRSVKIRQEAEGYLELGMPQHALQTLGRLGDPAGFGVETLYLWGEGLRAMHRYFEALLPLKRASRLAPEDSRVRLALGWCYKRTGRLDLAIDSLQKALAAHPRDSLLSYNLACYLSLAGKKQQALHFLSQAVTLAPEYRAMAEEESDFDSLRADPCFRAICAGRSAARPDAIP